LRRIALGFSLAFSVVACGGPVPLDTDVTAQAWGGCILMHEVVDVVARRSDGTPINKDTGKAFVWPIGFTAQRIGIEVEVLNADGEVVLTTGQRYSMCPSEYLDGWVIGNVTLCPDCKLGFELD